MSTTPSVWACRVSSISSVCMRSVLRTSWTILSSWVDRICTSTLMSHSFSISQNTTVDKHRHQPIGWSTHWQRHPPDTRSWLLTDELWHCPMSTELNAGALQQLKKPLIIIIITFNDQMMMFRCDMWHIDLVLTVCFMFTASTTTTSLARRHRLLWRSASVKPPGWRN